MGIALGPMGTALWLLGTEGDCNDDKTGAGVAAAVGLPGVVPGWGEALLPTGGESSRSPACVAGLGLGLVSPGAGVAVGGGVAAALVPIGGDTNGAGDALVSGDMGGDANGAGDALSPDDMGGDAPELLG